MHTYSATGLSTYLSDPSLVLGPTHYGTRRGKSTSLSHSEAIYLEDGPRPEVYADLQKSKCPGSGILRSLTRVKALLHYLYSKQNWDLRSGRHVSSVPSPLSIRKPEYIQYTTYLEMRLFPSTWQGLISAQPCFVFQERAYIVTRFLGSKPHSSQTLFYLTLCQLTLPHRRAFKRH